MFKVILLQKVIEGTIHNPGKGSAYLQKKLEVPFVPFPRMEITFPFHSKSILPSMNAVVELENVSWSVRDEMFTALCTTRYLVDLLNPDFAETELLGFLSRQTANAWDSYILEPTTT